MQSLLNQLNTLPGITGSLVYNPEGQILVQAFPADFDAGPLSSVVGILLNGMLGFEVAAGSVSMLDVRFRGARIIVRPVKGATLLLLCTPQANLSFLNISVEIVIPKIEKQVASQAILPLPVAPGATSQGQEALGQALDADVEKLRGFEKVFLRMDSWIRKKSGIRDA